MQKKVASSILGALGMLLLILDAKTAIHSAQEAIELCLYSVVPTIFPFLVLSCYLTPRLSAVNGKRKNPICRILGIPNQAFGIYLVGLLGGYPAGAQSIRLAYDRGQLDKATAQRMLTFCNNAGPAFLFGILANSFPNARYLWVLWGVHILSTLLVARLCPVTDTPRMLYKPQAMISLTDSLKKSVVTMGYVCGWILLFRMLLGFFDSWFLWLFPAEIQVILYGMFELANGCCSLGRIADIGLRFVVAGGILAFGGFCVAMQTASVAGDLGIKHYLRGKLLQMLICIGMCFVLQMQLFFPSNLSLILVFLSFAAVISTLMFRKSKKNSSIPAVLGV